MQDQRSNEEFIQTLAPWSESLGKRLRRLFRNGRRRLAMALVRTAFRLAIAGTKPYEPIEIGGRRYQNARESQSRWQAIATALKEYGARNVLDVGCAEGWFLRRAAADLKCFAIGIEASERVLISELARLYDGLERTAIMTALVTADDILALPKFDAVICTSVVHHVIRRWGLAGGQDFMRALSTRANKVVLFEMGTSGEKDWSGILPKMEEGQEPFVRGFLEDCGLTHIRLIAESEGFRREDQRLLFSAEPRA
jgi:SAM-dependent methyltransferase